MALENDFRALSVAIEVTTASQSFHELAIWAAVIGALIASLSALLLYVLRDILLEGRRDRRRRKRELVGAKLREIYSPLWVTLGGEDGALPNILGDKQMRVRVAANFHLLSPELQRLFEKILLIGTLSDNGLTFYPSDGKMLLDLQPVFVKALKCDLQKLQGDFEKF